MSEDLSKTQNLSQEISQKRIFMFLFTIIFKIILMDDRYPKLNWMFKAIIQKSKVWKKMTMFELFMIGYLTVKKVKRRRPDTECYSLPFSKKQKQQLPHFRTVFSREKMKSYQINHYAKCALFFFSGSNLTWEWTKLL